MVARSMPRTPLAYSRIRLPLAVLPTWVFRAHSVGCSLRWRSSWPSLIFEYKGAANDDNAASTLYSIREAEHCREKRRKTGQPPSDHYCFAPDLCGSFRFSVLHHARWGFEDQSAGFDQSFSVLFTTNHTDTH